jgi:TIGR03009 family protein
MRPYGLVLAALLTAGAAAPAQQAAPAGGAPPAGVPPAAAAAPTALDSYLLRWEQEMQKVERLSAQLQRIDKDPVSNMVSKFVGYAAYMKAGTGPTALSLAVLELRKEDGKELAEKYICTGTFLYDFQPVHKEIKVYELPKPKPGQVADHNLMALLFGMRAGEAKSRYDLKLFKEDQYYVYVDILPREERDRNDFVKARLVLNKDSFLPRQLWFAHRNGGETTWDIPRLQNGAALDRRLFDAPQEPPGWRKVVVQPPPQGERPQPRVIRPSP